MDVQGSKHISWTAPGPRRDGVIRTVSLLNISLSLDQIRWLDQAVSLKRGQESIIVSTAKNTGPIRLNSVAEHAAVDDSDANFCQIVDCSHAADLRCQICSLLKKVLVWWGNVNGVMQEKGARRRMGLARQRRRPKT